MLPRAGWVGTWRHGAVLWSGDIGSTMPVLKSQINIGISAQTSAIPWWTTDVGGCVGGSAITVHADARHCHLLSQHLSLRSPRADTAGGTVRIPPTERRLAGGFSTVLHAHCSGSMAPEITHAPGFTETRPKLCVCCLPSKATSTRAVVVRGLNTPRFVHPTQIIEDVIRLRAAMKPYFSAQLDMLNATGRPFNRKYNAISITDIPHQTGGRLIIFRALCSGPLMWDFPHDPQTWILAEKGIGDGGGGSPPPPSTSLTNGDFVVLAECNSSDATQQWKLDPKTNNLQLTANAQFCLDCGGTNPKVHMWTCSHQWHDAQAWSYNPQTKALEDSRRGGACLTTGGDSAKVGLSGAGSSCAQWTFSGAMSGSVKAAGGKCLAVTQQTGGGGGATGVIDQYMMGDDYMAAPVLNLGQRARDVYFPVGADWTHHYTSKVYKGGTTQSVEAPLSTFPLFRRTPATL
eukprot:COSAG01_NODE_2741_length_7157_cov_10.590677_2_plen_460_part_00